MASSSKRQAAKEWKRKRKQQKMILRLALAGVCALILAVIGYFAWDIQSRAYVMTFEGQRIPRVDMDFFAPMSIDSEDMIEQVAHFLLIDQAARRNNIVLTAEELAEIEEQSETMRMMFAMHDFSLDSISDQRLNQFMSMEILAEHLADIYVPGIEVDEDEFQSALMSHMIFNRADFIDMELRVHLSPSEEEAWEVWEEFNNDGPAEDPDMMVWTLEDMQMMGFDQFTLMNIANLQPGDFTEPMPMGEDMTMIFIVNSLQEPEPDELEAEFREMYIRGLKMDKFMEILDGWRETADIQINQRGIDAIW